jgi:hypothetical protein
VTVTQPPAALAGNDTTYNININQIELQGTATDYSTLLWTTSGDGLFQNSGLLNAVYFPGTGDKASGSVNLTLTVSPVSPCSGNAADVIHILLEPGTGMAGHEMGLSISISPNPSQGIIYLANRGNKNMDARIALYNTSGQVLKSEMLGISSGIKRAIDISSFQKGIYF